MQLLDFDAYLFDLDGVVWHGTQPVAGVAHAINTLRQLGKSIRFLTNNAGRLRSFQTEKLRSMGIAAETQEMITSGWATARFLLSTYGPSSVHVMGTDHLKQEMVEAGHTVVEDHPDFVVTGYDNEFSYTKLDAAFRCIHYEGARFVACNEDPTYPDTERLRPGSGSLSAALACAVGRQPDLVVGKPHLPIMEMALQSIGIPAERCLMTGDKIDTDILGAHEIGMKTLYVLSGKGTQADLETSPVQPDFVRGSAAEICP